MRIEPGWRFYNADFSIQATHDDGTWGYVMLVRSPSERRRWLKLPEDVRDDDNGPPLYVKGQGETFERALQAANQLAETAKPI